VLIDLLNRENIDTHEVPTEVAIQALRFCRPSGRVNFGDAMLWAVARASAPARVWTFDRRFPADGIERWEP
jgi:predicted nucleic acid-binding protein